MRPLCSTAMRRAPCRAEEQEVCDARPTRDAPRGFAVDAPRAGTNLKLIRRIERVQNLSMITGASIAKREFMDSG